MSSSKENIKIVVLDRGFVFVGRVVEKADGVYIENARCIRKWGTENGLGQLADGPTSKTVLDAPCTVRPQMKAVMFTIDCVGSKWSAHIT